MATPTGLQRFKLDKVLGSGQFANVVHALDTVTKQTFAMKIIDKSKVAGQEQFLESEINVLRKVNHPNIIRLYDVFETPERFYLQMELVTGGELFDRIVETEIFYERKAKQYVANVLDALEYLHSQDIAHRDLKPENLILSDKTENATVKLADFGLSAHKNKNEFFEIPCGTVAYMAPEIMNESPYGLAVDMWALGVITYVLLSGFAPFPGDNDDAIIKNTLKGHYEFFNPEWDGVSAHARDFVAKCLNPQAALRITASEAVKHPWICEEIKETRSEEVARTVASNIARNFKPLRRLKSKIGAVMFLKMLQKDEIQIEQSSLALSKSFGDLEDLTPKEEVTKKHGAFLKP